METVVDIHETHYIHLDIFKMTKLMNDLLSEHGGVSMECVWYRL